MFPVPPQFRRTICLIAGTLICQSLVSVSALQAEQKADSATVAVSKNDSSTAPSDKTTESAGKKRKNGASKSVSPLPDEREQEIIQFAKSHHPELAQLLQRLKKHNPRQFKRAVRDLDNTLTKLERFKKRDSDRYRLTLARWEIDSRIRLLAARVSVMGNSTDESELKSLLKQRVELQLEQLKMDQKQAETRLERLNKSISAIERDQDEFVNAELKKLKRSIQKSGQQNRKQK